MVAVYVPGTSNAPTQPISQPTSRLSGHAGYRPRGENVMQAALLTTKASQPRGVLYPLLVIAAISVIVFSILGAAAIAGWLPRAQSGGQSGGDRPLPQQQGTPVAPSSERATDYRFSGNRHA